MTDVQNPLASMPIWRLIAKYSIPAVVSGLVGALYNITDQIFIGWGVGDLGMAATNVAFPFSTVCMSLALLLGVGSAANFNLMLGRGEEEKAKGVAGAAVTLLALCGAVVSLLSFIFLSPLLSLFGATDAVMPYAETYTSITALGFGFFIFSIGAGKLIRADGAPVFSMVCVLSGAVFNIIGTPLFMFVFDMGIAGAALATVLGQAMSSALAVFYFVKKARVIRVKARYLKPFSGFAGLIILAGAAPGVNQAAVTAVQISLNNLLTKYGEASAYGGELPLAAAGATSKVFIIFISVVLGIAQGCQPVVGFNYGAQNFGRVRETYRKAALTVLFISLPVLTCFQLIPGVILGVFGSESDAFFDLGTRFLRVNFMMLPLIAVQIVSTNFFTAVGKPVLGLVTALTRQVMFLLPLMFLFSYIGGLDGIIYAGPVSDSAAFILAALFVVREMKKMNRKRLIGD